MIPSSFPSAVRLTRKLQQLVRPQLKRISSIWCTVYGGIEDVTDNTKGIALALNASRLIYDGGLLDAQISSQQYLPTLLI